MHTDIVISGAGPAGLIAAAVLAQTQRQITLIDPSDIAAHAPHSVDHTDYRSTAFLSPAIVLFERIGIWAALRPHAQALHGLRIVDMHDHPPRIRDQRTFTPHDLAQKEFGFNILNTALRQTLITHLHKLSNVRLLSNNTVTALFTRTNGQARLTLGNGEYISCNLVIAADGRNSTLRQQAGIGTDIKRYGQSALAFIATHERPHHNISTEFYHSGGPFTMVPIADINQRPASAIVWMNSARRTLELAAQPVSAFNAEMYERIAGFTGALEQVTSPSIFPVITQKANRLTGERLVLIAEAAHVLPPIGAQGLNTSLHDITALFEIIQQRAADSDPGAPQALDLYEAKRKNDVYVRMMAVDLFNRITRSDCTPLMQLRLAGLRLIHNVTPLRRYIMQAGSGTFK